MKHFFRSLCLLFLPLLLLPLPALAEEAQDDGDEEIELERIVELQARLISVERVPTRDTTVIARFRVTNGEYRGATFSLAYDFMPPVQLRSWDLHDVSGYRRLGGARFTELPTGQWDELLRPGSYEPVETVFLSLVQHDLNEDEEDRRWHSKRIEAILPLERYKALEEMMNLSTERSALRPDR
jgi:hypothetical protein